MIDPGTLCTNCAAREATVMWTGEGSVMDWNHGFWTPYCEVCATEHQLGYLRKLAALIPETQEKLAALLASEDDS